MCTVFLVSTQLQLAMYHISHMIFTRSRYGATCNVVLDCLVDCLLFDVTNFCQIYSEMPDRLREIFELMHDNFLTLMFHVQLLSFYVSTV